MRGIRSAGFLSPSCACEPSQTVVASGDGTSDAASAAARASRKRSLSACDPRQKPNESTAEADKEPSMIHRRGMVDNSSRTTTPRLRTVDETSSTIHRRIRNEFVNGFVDKLVDEFIEEFQDKFVEDPV